MSSNPDFNTKNKFNLLKKLIKMYSLLKVKQIKTLPWHFAKRKKKKTQS